VNQKLTRFMLENLGVEVLVADHGKIAYELIQKQPVDLVLMDWQMPVWDGLMATRAIRAWEAETHRPRLPIVALTANAMAGFDEVCREAGMDDFLTKPLREEDLRVTLAQWLPNRVASQAGRPAAPAREPGTEGEIPFDIAKVRRLCRNDARQVHEMLELFVRSTDDLIAALARAVDQHDGPGAARQAHQIKGAAAYLGAGDLTEQAASLERAAKEQDWAQVEGVLDDLQAAFIRVRFAIEQLTEAAPAGR